MNRTSRYRTQFFFYVFFNLWLNLFIFLVSPEMGKQERNQILNEIDLIENIVFSREHQMGKL